VRRELNRRLQAPSTSTSTSGVSSVTVMAVHPGVCRTDLGRYLFDPKAPINPIALPVVAPLLGVAALFTKSAAQVSYNIKS
jgi:NAD(P)-dependent dehydrogenase (short-subunit alcohol dehydrogenase family)